MVEMDITDTEFDPTLDEPSWSVTVTTHTKEYSFKDIETAQKDALMKLSQGSDYHWCENGREDYIWYRPVERITVLRGRTKREKDAARQRSTELRRRRVRDYDF